LTCSRPRVANEKFENSTWLDGDFSARSTSTGHGDVVVIVDPAEIV
jgi:hypothetical protein